MAEAWDVGGKRHDFADQLLAWRVTGPRTWSLSSGRESARWFASLASGLATAPTPTPSPEPGPEVPSPSPSTDPSL